MKKLSSFYTGVLILLPILNIYGSFIPSIEIGTLILLILSVIFLFSGKSSGFGYDKMWILVLLVLLTCTIISTQFVQLNSDYNFRYFARYLKIVVIVLVVCALGKNFFNYEFAQKFLTKTSIVCSLFMFVQYALFMVGVKIRGILSFIPAAVHGDDSVERVAEGLFRPSSFFIEPSNFAVYQLVFICYLLTHPNVEKRKQYLIITLIAILLSTSGTGYVSVLVVIFASLLLGGSKKKYNWKSLIGGLLAASLFFVLITNTSIGQQSIGRFLNDDGTLGIAATGRIQSGADELYFSLPTFYKWFGCGFGYRPDDYYFSSLYAILYGDGILGLSVIILMIIYYYYHTSNFGKLLCLAFSVLFVGVGIFSFQCIGLYFCFISTETYLYQKERIKNHVSIR